MFCIVFAIYLYINFLNRIKNVVMLSSTTYYHVKDSSSKRVTAGGSLVGRTVLLHLCSARLAAFCTSLHAACEPPGNDRSLPGNENIVNPTNNEERMEQT